MTWVLNVKGAPYIFELLFLKLATLENTENIIIGYTYKGFPSPIIQKKSFTHNKLPIFLYEIIKSIFYELK